MDVTEDSDAKNAITEILRLPQNDSFIVNNELLLPNTECIVGLGKGEEVSAEEQFNDNSQKQEECQQKENQVIAEGIDIKQHCDDLLTKETSALSPKFDTSEVLSNGSLQTVDNSEILSVCQHLISSVEEMVKNQNVKNYRQIPDDNSETSTDSEESSESSSDESSSDSSDSDISEVNLEKSSKAKEVKYPQKHQAPCTRGELSYADLPPIENLHITLPKEDIHHIGSVHAIVECLVVVESFPGSPALDLDTVLFLENDKPLGQVFDVLGQVNKPCYTVRFNKEEDIAAQGIEIGMAVYYAPSHSEITSFVFIEQLKKLKGSDASWEHNNEPPERYLDYSDDEEERKARAKLRNQNQEKLKNDGNENPSKKVQCVRPQIKAKRQHYHQNGNHPVPNGFPLLRPPRFRHDHPRQPVPRDRFASPRPWFGSSSGSEFPRPEFQRPYNPGRFCGNRFERPVGPPASMTPFHPPLDTASAPFRHFGPTMQPFMCSQTFPPAPPNNQPNFGVPNNHSNFGNQNNPANFGSPNNQSHFGQSHNPLISQGYNFSVSNQGSCPLPQWKTPGFPPPPPPPCSDGSPRFPPVGFVSSSNFRPSFNM